MIHDAMKVAYSSIVGQSIMLLNEKGACIGQLSVINCENPQEIADEVASALKAPNRHAYQVGKKVGEAAGSSELLSEIKRLRAENSRLREVSLPNYNTGSIPDVLPVVNETRMIWQPVRNSLSEGNNLTMKLAPLGWQPSSAHHALEALADEIDRLRAENDRLREALSETTDMLSRATFEVMRVNGQYVDRKDVIARALAALQNKGEK